MSNSIKFDHIEGGEIKFCSKSTSLANLFTIGAVSLTSKRIWKDDVSHLKYATDRQGLENVSLQAESAVSFLHNATHSIGVLLAHADINEIKRDISSIAWLIAGLGELAEIVSAAKSEMDYVLMTKEQPQKSPDK